MRPMNPQIDGLLLSPAYVESPYGIYDLLRNQCPVYWSDRWRAWLLTRYADVKAALLNHGVFSNAGRYSEFLRGLPENQQAELTYLREHYEHGGLVQLDPPAHTRLRKLVSFAFFPRIVQGLEPLVSEVIHDLIDGMAATDEVELIRQVAFPLPAIVIAGILGVPKEDRDEFKVWSSTIQRFLGSGEVDFELALAAQESWRHLNDYFRGLLAERRQSPREDMVSALAFATSDDGTLSEDELVRTCGAMLIAGHETTTNLISNAILCLLTHPEQVALLQADASLYSTAVDEFLRLESPFQTAPRIVRAEFALHGHTLRQGDLVYAMLGAANRDPSQFARADQVDIRRADNPHLAFGHGVHTCIGAALARLEGAIALRALVERLRGLHLDVDRPPVWKRSMVQRGMEQFWLRYDAVLPHSARGALPRQAVSLPHARSTALTDGRPAETRR
jgi:cytochrome P450